MWKGYSGMISNNAVYLRGWLNQLLLICGICIVSGCSESVPIVPVSGHVTLDGKPLAGATIRFMPKPDKNPEVSKMMAMGTTNEHGQYSLQVFRGPGGAVVGPSRVTIMTLVENENGRPIVEEKVPAKYNIQSKLEFDVPPQGTDNANFELSSS